MTSKHNSTVAFVLIIFIIVLGFFLLIKVKEYEDTQVAMNCITESIKKDTVKRSISKCCAPYSGFDSIELCDELTKIIKDK